MSENHIDQLKAAANEPELSIEEYKEQRNTERSDSGSSSKYDDRPRPYEKELESEVDHSKSDTKETEEEEREYKPWETETKKEDETEVEDDDVIVTDKDNKVPLHKLLKLKAQKKEKEAELERYKREVEEYKSIITRQLPKEEAEVIVDPIERKLKELKKPNSNDYDDYDKFINDSRDYETKVKEIEEERIVARVRKSFEEELNQTRVKEEQKKVIDSFVNRIEKASESNPEIKKAVGWFESKIVENGIQNFNPNIQAALVNDDNAPELIHRVVKDRELIKEIFEGGNTVQILKKIGRLSTYIELEKEDDTETTTYEKPKKVVPRSFSGSQSGSTKDSSKADTMEEYKKLRRLEDQKNKKR